MNSTLNFSLSLIYEPLLKPWTNCSLPKITCLGTLITGNCIHIPSLVFGSVILSLILRTTHRRKISKIYHKLLAYFLILCILTQCTNILTFASLCFLRKPNGCKDHVIKMLFYSLCAARHGFNLGTDMLLFGIAFVQYVSYCRPYDAGDIVTIKRLKFFIVSTSLVVLTSSIAMIMVFIFVREISNHVLLLIMVISILLGICVIVLYVRMLKKMDTDKSKKKPHPYKSASTMIISLVITKLSLYLPYNILFLVFIYMKMHRMLPMLQLLPCVEYLLNMVIFSYTLPKIRSYFQRNLVCRKRCEQKQEEDAESEESDQNNSV